MNLRHRLRKLEARVPPPPKEVTLVWMRDGVASYVLIPGVGELHGEDAQRYMEQRDRLEADQKDDEHEDGEQPEIRG